MEMELIGGCASLIALAVAYLIWIGAFDRRRTQASGAPSSRVRRRDVDAARPRRDFQGDHAGRSMYSPLPHGEDGKGQGTIAPPSRPEHAGRAAAAAAASGSPGVEMKAARAAAAAAAEARATATTVSRRPTVQAATKYHGQSPFPVATASRQGNGVSQMDATASSEEEVVMPSAGRQQLHHHQQEGAVRREFKDGEKRLKLARATGVLSSMSGILEEDLSSLAPKLRVLSLEDQSLADIPLMALPLPCLTRAALAGNNLSSLPCPLSLPRVEKLDLARNDLGELPGGSFWAEMKHLRELRVSRNRLTSLPGGISLAPSLRLLDISGNLITSLDSVISHADGAFEELVDMDASDNRLEALPPGMGALRNLKRLNVGKNQLKSLPESLLEGTRVERIVAAGNPLTMKQQKGFDAYLERVRRRVVEDGRVYEFSHKDLAHERERARRVAAGEI